MPEFHINKKVPVMLGPVSRANVGYHPSAGSLGSAHNRSIPVNNSQKTLRQNVPQNDNSNNGSAVSRANQ